MLTRSATDTPTRRLRIGPRMLLALLVLGLLVRVAVLSQTSSLGTPVTDEQHYSALAQNIVAGNGYASSPGAPTSIRPPLYPALLASIWRPFGTTNLQAVRIVQILLSAATALLVYWIGATVWDEQVARIAAVLFWLYPSFIYYDFLILTETLFTFLLIAFVFATLALIRTPRPLFAVACGLSLGLAALTRSVLWPLPLLLCPALVLLVSGSWARRAALAFLVFAGYLVVVGPWAIRNTRLQHVVTVVDTMGGMNLRMGNYEYTPDDRMWDAVSLTGEKNWMHDYQPNYPGEPVTEGRKDKWAQRKAIDYMRTHPGVTLRRSVIKFADFWGLEREYMAGVQQGMYSPPIWFEVVAFVALLTAFAAVALTGAAGVWLATPRDIRAHVVLLMPVVVLMGAHTLVFGHSRYHLPVIPILALYAAALLAHGLPKRLTSRRLAFFGAAASVAILSAVWVRQIVVTDFARIQSFLKI
jgi:4-amino-4-deoxy-L-arabinose transferase-like glycosyltransferase